MDDSAEDLDSFKITQRIFNRRRELERLSKNQLVDLVLRVEGLPGSGTDAVLRPTGTRPFDLPWEPRGYVRLPAGSEDGRQSVAQASRRIALVSFDLAHPVIGLEVCGDIVMGRGTDTVKPDLDLTQLDAAKYGVSRKHALLRAADEDLQLVDLGSLNGTRCNGARLTPEVPQVLRHEDIIELGSLQFQFRIMDGRG